MPFPVPGRHIPERRTHCLLKTLSALLCVCITAAGRIVNSVEPSRSVFRMSARGSHSKITALGQQESSAEAAECAHPCDFAKDDERDTICREMVSSLSDDEKELAARCSYQYCHLEDSTPTERDEYAAAMARRHLVAENGHNDRALAKMKATLQYREDMNIEVIRQCFYREQYPDDVGGSELHEKYRAALNKELSGSKTFVRGKSVDGRALYVVLPHKFTSGFDPEWYMKYNIYTLERAIAITENASDGRLEKVVVVFDFGSYSHALRPPMGLSKELQFCLRDHYPERVDTVVLVDTPFIFRAFWAIMKPFIDPVTRRKVKFVTGDDHKTEVLGGLIEADQAMSFMRPDGERAEEMDMKKYLFDTPFDEMCVEDR